MFEAGDKQSARRILELVIAREIDDHQLDAANFLGLAEIRLATGYTAGALDLLRRLVVAVGSPFENLDPAAALLEKTGHGAEAVEFLDQLVKSSPWDSSYRLRFAKAKVAAGKDAVDAENAVVAIAAATNASYDLRLQASLALVGHSHPDLASGEVNLLAGSFPALTVAAADKFYFYAARIKAVQETADPQIRLQLLSHCVIDFPHRDEVRVPLFQAATAAAQSDEYALAILESLLETKFLRNDVSGTGEEEEQIASSGNEDEENNDGPTAPATPVLKLSRAQQAKVAQMIGDTMARLNRLTEAVAYYKNARQGEVSPAVRKSAAAQNSRY